MLDIFNSMDVSNNASRPIDPPLAKRKFANDYPEKVAKTMIVRVPNRFKFKYAEGTVSDIYQVSRIGESLFTFCASSIAQGYRFLTSQSRI